jgi:hypothetical protein
LCLKTPQDCRKFTGKEDPYRRQQDGKTKKQRRKRTMAKESITCEIKRHIGILSCSTSGWRKEFNEVSWNGGAQKYDIRDWSADHRYNKRASTMTREEAEALYVLLGKELKRDGE